MAGGHGGEEVPIAKRCPIPLEAGNTPSDKAWQIAWGAGRVGAGRAMALRPASHACRSGYRKMDPWEPSPRGKPALEAAGSEFKPEACGLGAG